MERKSNLTLPSYVWAGKETAKWPNAAEGETVAAFFMFVWDERPPPNEKFFSFEGVFFVGRGSTRGGKCGRSCTRGGTSSRLGGMTPPLLCWRPLPNGFGSMHPRGEGRESRQSGGLRWWLLSRKPPPS